MAVSKVNDVDEFTIIGSNYFQGGNVSFTFSTESDKLKPTKVIFNDRTTIVYWNDGTKSISTCSRGEAFDEEIGFAMCLAKKMFGKKKYQKIIKRAERQQSKKSTPIDLDFPF